MNKNKTTIFLTVFLLAFTALNAFGARDLFLQRLETCSPYKTVFKNPITGESFEKAVLGKVEYQRNDYCVFYKQTAPSQYLLCAAPLFDLDFSHPFDKIQYCKKTTRQGIASVQTQTGLKSYVLDNFMINNGR